MRVGRALPVGSGGKKVLVKHRHDACQQRIGPVLVHRQQGVLQAVAFFIGGVGTVKGTGVVQRLAQRKAVANAGVVRQRLALCIHALQHRQVGVIGLVSFERREVVVRLNKIGPRVNCRLKAGTRLIKLALLAANCTRIVLRLGMLRIDGNGVLIGRQRRRLVALLLQRRAQVVPRKAMASVELERLAVALNGPCVILVVGIGQTQVVMRVKIGGRKFGGVSARLHRLIQLTQAAVHLTQIAVVQRHFAIHRNGGLDALHRQRQVASIEDQQAQRVPCSVVNGVIRDDLAVGQLGLRQLPLALKCQGVHHGRYRARVLFHDSAGAAFQVSAGLLISLIASTGRAASAGWQSRLIDTVLPNWLLGFFKKLSGLYSGVTCHHSR